MKAFNRNDKDVKDQILHDLRAADVDNILTIELYGDVPSLEVTISYDKLNLTSKKLSLAYDVYSIYLTESDLNWIKQSIDRIKKIESLMSLENVKLVKVNNLIEYSKKTEGFVETNSFDRVNQYMIYVMFDEIEIAADLIRSDDSAVSASSYVHVVVTDTIESDFKTFEKLVSDLRSVQAEEDEQKGMIACFS